MKYVFLVIMCVLSAYSYEDDFLETNTALRIAETSTSSVTITLILKRDIAGKALGLDVLTGSETHILGVDDKAGTIQKFDLNCAMEGFIPLDSLNSNCYGVACNNQSQNPTYYTNDLAAQSLFFSDNDGVSWITKANPAKEFGRGMDFDGTDYWITQHNDHSLWRFRPGVGQQKVALPEVPTSTSGLTVFPLDNGIGIAVTCYATHSIYFYQWNDSAISLLGVAPCPVENIKISNGLAYCADNNLIYWSYSNNTNHLAVFSFDIQQALEQSSWGSIKSSF